MLRLHFAQPLQVGARDGRPVVGRIGRVDLGGRGPFLEVAHDFGRLVVEGGDFAVPWTAAHEPHPAIRLGKITAEPSHLRERAAGILGMAGRTKGVDVAQNTVAAEWHARHNELLRARLGTGAS